MYVTVTISKLRLVMTVPVPEMPWKNVRVVVVMTGELE